MKFIEATGAQVLWVLRFYNNEIIMSKVHLEDIILTKKKENSWLWAGYAIYQFHSTMKFLIPVVIPQSLDTVSPLYSTLRAFSFRDSKPSSTLIANI